MIPRKCMFWVLMFSDSLISLPSFSLTKCDLLKSYLQDENVLNAGVFWPIKYNYVRSYLRSVRFFLLIKILLKMFSKVSLKINNHMNTERIFQPIDKDKLARSLSNMFHKIKKTDLLTDILFMMFHSRLDKELSNKGLKTSCFRTCLPASFCF